VDEKDLWWVPLVIAAIGGIGTIVVAVVANRTDPRIVRTIAALTDQIAKISAETPVESKHRDGLVAARLILIERLLSRTERRILKAIAVWTPAAIGLAASGGLIVAVIRSPGATDASPLLSTFLAAVGAAAGAFVVAGISIVSSRVHERRAASAVRK
jgi:hypothetical protein